MTFGENLKALRIARSLSQREIAESLGFSFQNISKWERSDSLPDISTLLDIAVFFGTTTDALLGHAAEKQFATLKIGANEVKIYSSYPSAEEKTSEYRLFIAIDAENKLAGLYATPTERRFLYKKSYFRRNHNVFDDNSTISFEFRYDGRNGPVYDTKKIRIPNGGFLISAPNRDYAVKKIMNFIIPEEYRAYLDPEWNPMYYNGKWGRYLFSDILTHNELDNITVELIGGEVVFTKPAEQVDPMSVNIETLAKIVRRELEKEHEKQIEELQNRIDELSELAYDNESRIDDLEMKIDDLEMLSENEDE